ncbi:MAG: hypothetical protein AAF581_11190 [Planctomycetota bacterium]
MATRAEIIAAAEDALYQRAKRGFLREYEVGDTKYVWESEAQLRSFIREQKALLAAENSGTGATPVEFYHVEFPKE